MATEDVLDHRERFGVRGGRLQDQVVRPRPDDTGACGQAQPTGVGVALDRLHPGLAAEVGQQLLGVAGGGVGRHDRRGGQHDQAPKTSMAPSWSNSNVTLPPATTGTGAVTPPENTSWPALRPSSPIAASSLAR